MSAARAAGRWIAGGGTVVVAAALITMVMLYVFPRQDTPTRTDAIIVLGGLSSAPVLDRAQRLAADEVSGRIVISDAFGGDTKPATLCRSASHYDISCFTPDPGTTAGEAQAVAKLAADNHWESLTVVTADYHVSRARVIVEQCFGGDVSMVGAAVPMDAAEWLHQFVYQTGGFMKLLMEPAC